jgi:tetratricopeptide (TPR) repeat protein
MEQTLTHTSYFPLLNSFRSRMIIVLISCLLLNFNTLQNEYALDDEMVIGKNMNMHMGFSGIGKIFATDAYQGYLDVVAAQTPLSGGRYRPLSIVTFAIEEQLFTDHLGKEYWEARKKFEKLQSSAASMESVDAAAKEVKDIEAQIKQQTLEIAPIRHAFQVIYFTLSMLILFWFLHRYLLPNNQDIAFLATLLFVFHPIHTEVIANVKSRDELFSFMFIILSCICVFRYMEKRTAKNLFWLILATIAALFSKEYGLLAPFVAFIAVVLVKGKKPVDIIKTNWFIIMSVMSVLFLLIRHSVVGGNKKFTLVQDVLNDPFLYATTTQKIATKIALLNEYLKLLIFPHPLSSDYSFSHFPYYSFTDWQVWASIIIWGGILYITFRLWQQRHILAFACLFFLAFFMLVNNLLYGIGATMGERLIYHSSLGFCIIAAWLIVKGIQKTETSHKAKSILLTSVSAIILILAGYKTIARNPDWKSDFTLFSRDVKYIENSALTNGNAGSEYYNTGYKYITGLKNPTHQDTVIFQHYIDTAFIYLTRSLTIHPRYVNTYINRALCYLQRGKMDSSIKDWKMAASHFHGRNPVLIDHAKMLLSLGKQLGSEKQYATAARYLRDASVLDAGNAEIWDNLGGSEFMQANFEAAATAFNNALALNPNLQDAKMGAGAANGFAALVNKSKQDSLNPAVWRELAAAYKQADFKTLSEEAGKKAAKLSGVR